MLRCPVCESAKIVVVIDDKRRAFCIECGSRWKQDGSEQARVQGNALSLKWHRAFGLDATGAPRRRVTQGEKPSPRPVAERQ